MPPIPDPCADRRRACSRHWRISSAKSSSVLSGSMMRTVASRSPVPSLPGKPLPRSRNTRPLLVPGGIASSTAPVERRHPHLAAERRLIQRDRQVEPQVVALAAEDRMRRDRHGDQRIAGRAARPRCIPWPLRRIVWPSASPAGIFTSTSLPLPRRTRREVPLAASGKRDRHRGGDIAPPPPVARNPRTAERLRARPPRAPPCAPNTSLRMSSMPPPRRNRGSRHRRAPPIAAETLPVPS